MGKLFKVDLSGPRIYSCAKCRCHLAKSEDIISKLEAYEEAQKYKQGKFILEKQRMDKEPGWT